MSEFWSAYSALALPWAIGLVASFALEQVLQPRPRAPWRRPLSSLWVHVGVWTVAFGLELALFRRPAFAAANVFVIQGVLVAVNNAKFRSLREPFVTADFEYFIDAMRHPRLYLPFLGWAGLVVPIVGYALCVALAFRFESAYGATAGRWLGAVALLVAGGMALTLVAARWLPAASFRASADLRRAGLAALLWTYGRAERRSPPRPLSGFPFVHLRPQPAAALPHLVSIQSESFFDPRARYPLVRPEVLAGWDALRAEAVATGRLRVAAWGANTVRSEFGFLSGVSAEELGVHRYNPYRSLGRRPVPTIASHLREWGYRTVCVHPYHASFYRRDRVLPRLGFDAFTDISAFAPQDRVGAYVGDMPVAEHVARLLREAGDQPLYVHVITMENHGPLHWETVSQAEREALFLGALPDGCDELAAYVRHLRNADRMFVHLSDTMRALDRPASLCVYGDHVPIMEGVYGVLGEPDGRTDYLLWNAGGTAPRGGREELAVHDLGQRFLRAAGLQRQGQGVRAAA
ncbi:LTA synthase family protein [Bordetella genomosp. 1]|uniref:Capsular biosynthesis protein n=1 Tax=Bordetella genomosp. 1 TaxID=1395607 RepID=A0ABX4EYR4_9BORD|nr:LTA synthase family protein [Bordetella genomosp. 1]OZI64236.1 capsular biosynthesis protein [Bordetella genomosp. 1]